MKMSEKLKKMQEDFEVEMRKVLIDEGIFKEGEKMEFKWEPL